MAWEHLEVDQRLVRPGHPLPNRTPARTSAARDGLVTSTNTVRRMIADGSLGGYWRRAGSRTTFYVYLEDLEAYLASNGPLDGRRRRPRGPVADPLRSPSHSEAGDDTSGTIDYLNELRSLLVGLADRISALEQAVGLTRGPLERRASRDLEQRRRLELEDALAALEADDAAVAEADGLSQQAYTKLRDAHMQLRASIARIRRPRTVADLQGALDEDVWPD